MAEQTGAGANVVLVDIVSDVVCPWCALGWRRFEAAQAQSGVATRVRWRSFLLNPQTPPGGRNYREHLAAKYGAPPEQGDAMRANLTEMGSALGFKFNFTPTSRTWNTEAAHQLLHWARASGAEHALKLALFKAHFTDNRAMDDPATLAEIAGEVGLDTREATAVLADERFAEAVREEAAQWPRIGVQGVPTFIFNESQALSGAQPVEMLAGYLKQLAGGA